jgi:hypothetical protein
MAGISTVLQVDSPGHFFVKERHLLPLKTARNVDLEI